MEVSFFRRRNILKQANSLDLHPVKLIDSEARDENTLNLLLPRFRNKTALKLFRPHWKPEFIRIKLDEFGSAVWAMIDGNRCTSDICVQLKETFPEKLNPIEETEERVSKFLFILYQQRFISFREIQKNPG
ncbi:MAG: PqqD family protein [Bacteroidota bacterium]|jgi:Coenzyme PQQ synthesis protein D (PqqD)